MMSDPRQLLIGRTSMTHIPGHASQADSRRRDMRRQRFAGSQNVLLPAHAMCAVAPVQCFYGPTAEAEQTVCK
jgi:hypothetical protein